MCLQFYFIIFLFQFIKNLINQSGQSVRRFFIKIVSQYSNKDNTPQSTIHTKKMSFYITIKQANLSGKHQDPSHHVAIVITSQNNRLFSSFTISNENPKWGDAFVAESTQRQLQFMLVKQKQKNKSVRKLSSNCINLSKYIFLTKDHIEQIPLYIGQGEQADKLIVQICYRENKHFIGPIQFYKKGGDDFEEEDDQPVFEIEGDTSKFPFWQRIFGDKKQKPHQGQGEKVGQNTGINGKESVKFYKGPHINRNFFSLCDQVHDDQKFTVVENYYNDD